MSMYDIVILAATPPAGAPDPGSAPTVVGYGGMLVGAGAAIYVIAKWQHINKDGRRMFVLGLVVAALLGSTTGIFGSLGNSLRETGDSVGDSVTDTTTGQR